MRNKYKYTQVTSDPEQLSQGTKVTQCPMIRKALMMNNTTPREAERQASGRVQLERVSGEPRRWEAPHTLASTIWRKDLGS